MSRTFGAFGMFINKEFAKKVIRRRASKFDGTFMADSFVVKSKWSLRTYREMLNNIKIEDVYVTNMIFVTKDASVKTTFSLQ
jgi:predicted acyltransferase